MEDEFTIDSPAVDELATSMRRTLAIEAARKSAHEGQQQMQKAAAEAAAAMHRYDSQARDFLGRLARIPVTKVDGLEQHNASFAVTSNSPESVVLSREPSFNLNEPFIQITESTPPTARRIDAEKSPCGQRRAELSVPMLRGGGFRRSFSSQTTPPVPAARLPPKNRSLGHIPNLQSMLSTARMAVAATENASDMKFFSGETPASERRPSTDSLVSEACEGRRQSITREAVSPVPVVDDAIMESVSSRPNRRLIRSFNDAVGLKEAARRVASRSAWREDDEDDVNFRLDSGPSSPLPDEDDEDAVVADDNGRCCPPVTPAASNIDIDDAPAYPFADRRRRRIRSHNDVASMREKARQAVLRCAAASPEEGQPNGRGTPEGRTQLPAISSRYAPSQRQPPTRREQGEGRALSASSSHPPLRE
eukprot:Opistho-1_new@2614